MKRGFKNIKTGKNLNYFQMLNSIDKSVDDLMKNNLEIESILKMLNMKPLTDNEKDNIVEALRSSIRLSSEIKSYMEK